MSGRRSRQVTSEIVATRMGATTVEIPSGHVAMVSHSREVADLIETAAKAVTTAS
jgi:hypothetical protein